MTAGRLASGSTRSNTNTVLYSSDIADTTSAVVHVCERGGSAGTYRIGHKNYSQKLTLDANTYKFQPGNVVSKYQIEINPGLTVDDATPGLAIVGEESNFTAKIADVVRTTTTTTYYTKIATTGEVGIDSATIAGTFQGGETLTAATSGLTATYRGAGSTGFQIEIPDFAQAATQLKVSSAV